jgi:hypothetical protein
VSLKYRQPGYQDSDRKRDDKPSPGRRPPQRELTSEERIHRRSLRHATAREANEVIRCHQCGRNVENFGSIERLTGCPHCNAPLHCCRTCREFDSSARWQCRAPIELAVSDKSKSNDCGNYSPRVVLDTTGKRSTPGSRTSADPKDQFDSLFKR